VKADAGPLWGAAWVWFACTYGQTRADRELNALLGPVVTLHDAPLIMYEAATCAVGGDTLLADLAASDPRFHEIEFWTGSRQVAVQDLDGAQTTLTRAYGWHPAWPAVINSLANLYLTAEDFQTALEFYERSIALVPGTGESLLGRVRALSYLGRSEEAIARATELLPIGPPGDAYYWRAWNENRLDRLEPAWEDVEAARRLWVNSEVLKLAGLVAYRRRELDIARDRFESALKIPGNSDCEVVFDLAGVNVELASWNVGANLYASAATCFDQLRAGLAAEIAKLQQSGGNPDRVGRQVSSREEQRAGALRLQIQSWFNGAVANLQLGRREAARDLAEKVQEDDQFGARAKEILKRIQ
jgi:tetratricopeptide (TPR) repeat protein